MSTILSALLATPIALSGGADFEAPVMLMHGGESFENVIFPTPVLYDIDRDDERELVVGDLIGNIWSCEPERGGTWGKATNVVAANGKPIKLNNW